MVEIVHLSRHEHPEEIPVSYVLDGVFITPTQKVLVHTVPSTARFSPGTLDLPSLELSHVLSPSSMRHAIKTFLHAATNVIPNACDEGPFMADRTITPNNGSYRDTRRIFYKGEVPELEQLPDGYNFLDLSDKNEPLLQLYKWRRTSIEDAVRFAINTAGRPKPPGQFIMTKRNDGAIDTRVVAHTQRTRWNLTEQLELATQLDVLKLEAQDTLR